MMEYADEIGADDASTFWEGRLSRAAPGHYLLQRRRLGRLLFVEQPDWETALALAEVFWASSDPGDWNVAQTALNLALQAGEWEQAVIWARRLTDINPGQAYIAGTTLADYPATLSVSMDYLRRAVLQWNNDPERTRPLSADALEYSRQRANRLQRILVRLAQALVESGEYDEAVSVTARAVDLGWNSELLQQLAGYRLAAGDTAAALDMLASAAADPLNGSESEQIGRDLAVVAGLETTEWLQTVAEQRTLIRRWVLEFAEFSHVGPEMTVEAVNGRRVPIAALVPSQPTLIAVTPFMMGRFSSSALSRFSDLHERLATRGFPFVVLTTDVARSEFRGFLDDERPVFQVFRDPDNVSGEFLGVSRDIEYIVFDADGIVRGVHWNLDAALRLLYLLPQSRQVA
jgi:tetratricopeptide (TPR) repeat protein